MPRIVLGGLAVVLGNGAQLVSAEPPGAVLLVTVDTLRADRLSCYGYERETTPKIDALLRGGVRFTQARTVEPLTNPALASMLTTLAPHEHGATRNGLRMRPGLDSLTRALSREGWATVAFVGNWTLMDKITRMSEHFDTYEAVLTRKRWFGLINRESNASDVTDSALRWVEDHLHTEPERPFLLWVHYVDPHAPYRLHKSAARRLGIPSRDPSKQDRYDTEVAYVDAEIGRLLEELEPVLESPLVVFVADHGESLGEHGDWGHGRYLYEPTLRIPMGMAWKGHLEHRVLDSPAVIIDIAPTVLELVGVEVPRGFGGFSWVPVLRGESPPASRPLCYQAHRGAVHGNRDSDRKRSKGLLAVGWIVDGRKEILRMRSNEHQLFDLADDPNELVNLVDGGGRPSSELLSCVGEVLQGLETADQMVPNLLDGESRRMLKELGYLE